MEDELNSGTIFKDSESEKQIGKKKKESQNKSENQEEQV